MSGSGSFSTMSIEANGESNHDHRRRCWMFGVASDLTAGPTIRRNAHSPYVSSTTMKRWWRVIFQAFSLLKALNIG